MAVEAILFDLDGTLLDLDMDEFLPVYLDALGRSLAAHMDPDRLIQAVIAATSAMIADVDPAVTNEQAFWRDFTRRTGLAQAVLRRPLERFYREEFPRLGGIARAVPGARDVVAALRQEGLRLALATNPLFPRLAVEARLQWAGIEPELFDFIADYETLHACKPHAAFFLEVCRRLGVPPERALMVGNDPVIDIRGAARAGLRTYLVEGLAGPGAFERRMGEGILGDGAAGAVDPDGRGPLSGVPKFVRAFTNSARFP